MGWYRGKCASCGCGAKHKNFKGRPAGYGIPDPCFVQLRKRRPHSDDRLCVKCYKVHHANIPAARVPPTSSSKKRNRSSSSSLDGIHWTESDGDRVAKAVRMSSDGTPMIPLSLHKEKLQERTIALRQEAAVVLERRSPVLDDLDERDAVDAIFLQDDLSPADRANVFRRVVEYYKMDPSAERAQLLQDLTNKQAQQVAGISSRTLAKARSGNVEKKKAKTRKRKTKAGLSMEDVKEIALQACMDSRYCEVRSWKSHAGEGGGTHWECVGLVDIKTMWENLCRDRGDFCSLSMFYKAIPDFYVPKRKERCVCPHCKKGRRFLDAITVLLNAMRGSVGKDTDLRAMLDLVRLDLLTLRGHLDKEIVIDIADGHHEENTSDCTSCELIGTIPARIVDCLEGWVESGESLSISARDWSTVFPGIGLPPDVAGRVAGVLEMFTSWEEKVTPLVDHLLLKANRIKALENDIEELSGSTDAEVWLADYAMTVKLRGTFDETEEDFMCKDTANNLGFMRIYWDDGQLWREFWDFVFQDGKDVQSTIQIQKCFLQQVHSERQARELEPLRKLKIWGDNASDFKGGDMWDQWQKELQSAGRVNGDQGGLQVVELDYHAAGEGKTQLDGHFGHASTIRHQRERKGLERRSVGDLLDAMVEMEATHVFHVELDREDQSRFYRSAKGIKKLHSVEVTRDGMRGRKDAVSEWAPLELGEVRERKSKRSLQQREKQHGQMDHVALADECQHCHHQMKAGELLEEWIQCVSCERSWHKTCVG